MRSILGFRWCVRGGGCLSFYACLLKVVSQKYALFGWLCCRICLALNFRPPPEVLQEDFRLILGPSIDASLEPSSEDAKHQQGLEEKPDGLSDNLTSRWQSASWNVGIRFPGREIPCGTCLTGISAVCISTVPGSASFLAYLGTDAF